MEMLQNFVYHKALPFTTVLMDSWYTTNKLMLYIDDLGKYYYCPLKRNRLVDDKGEQEDDKITRKGQNRTKRLPKRLDSYFNSPEDKLKSGDGKKVACQIDICGAFKRHKYLQNLFFLFLIQGVGLCPFGTRYAIRLSDLL